MNKILLILLAALITGNANAEIYKWVDSNGKVQYGDHPPATNKTQKLKTETAPAPAQSANGEKAPAAKTMMDKELDFRKRRADAEETQKKEAKQANETKEKKENCANARSNLRAMQESGRIATYNEKGERSYMDDAGRQQAIDKAQKEVDYWCK